MNLQRNLQVLHIQFFLNFLAPLLISPTVARGTNWWNQIVGRVGSTVFHKNIFVAFATSGTITKADSLGNYTIFHCRMSSHQPTWPVCTTFVCRHTRCWHFCSCSSHKTIPSLDEHIVTQRTNIDVCIVIAFPVSLCQIFVVVTTIG